MPGNESMFICAWISLVVRAIIGGCVC